MRLSKFANPLVATLALAFAPVMGGCAAEAVDPERTESTSEASTVGEQIPIASGIFGIMNGGVTAYVTLDNLLKYGAPSPTTAILDGLKQANESLASLQSSQTTQFLQLKVDLVVGPINNLELKIDRAWGELETARKAAEGGPVVDFVPATLTWDDFDMLTTNLASVNGTSDAFSLIKEGMLAPSGPIADDPLGTYALRMRTRMAQVAYLMTRKTPITASQQAAYDRGVARFETSFAKATREYFVAKIAPVTSTGTTSACYPNWRLGYQYDTPTGTLSGYATSWACEADRVQWSTLTVEQARAQMVNTVWSQQDAFTTGKWVKRPGTISVTSAWQQTEDNDVTKALSLMCNGVENCSLPAATRIPRLGSDARLSSYLNLEVYYRCVGEDVDRSAFFRIGEDAVLTCNIQNAVAGVYVNTSHDATPGRGPEDTMVLEGALPSTMPSNLTHGSWTWTAPGSSQPAVSVSSTPDDWTVLESAAGSLKVEWGEQGHPVRIQSPNQTTWFGWTSPGVPSLPIVPPPQP